MFDFTKAQQEAIETLDRNVSVSAGAGSGKTRVLVERFVNILRQSLRQGGKQVVLPIFWLLPLRAKPRVK